MKYLILIKHPETLKREDVPQALLDAMGKIVTAAMKSGAMLDTAGLQPTKDGFRVRLAGGTINVIDGPFMETKEVIGGYALVEAKSREEALGFARQFMELHRIHFPAFEGECEVRPLESTG
jgi:hypothetical protein